MTFIPVIMSIAAAAVTPAPVLASASYPLVDSAGGDTLVLSGTGLGGVVSASWGGTACTVVGSTATTVTLTMPAKATGTYSLTVTTAGGVSNGLSVESWGFADGAFSGLWTGNYSGSPWVGVASAGGSTGRNLTEPTHPPTAGTGGQIVNGHVPALFDGVADILTGANLTTLLSNSGYEGFALFQGITAQTAVGSAGGAGYIDPCILVASASSRFSLSFTSIGVTVSHIDGGGLRPVVTAPCAVGGIHLAQFWFDPAGTINLQLDGGTPGSAASAPTANLSSTLGLGGLGSGSTKFFDGLTWAAGTASSLQGATFRSNVKNLVNLRYGTSF